jgi:hypothetical protein
MPRQHDRARGAKAKAPQALAVWQLEHARASDPLPHELARAAIAHYTVPDDLVLVPNLRGGELLQTAAAIGRRALPLAPQARSAKQAERIAPLRRDADAALVLAPLGARPTARRIEQVAARLLPLLRDGGFLALVHPERARASDGLGEVVRACQRQGLQYWQHVVALRPAANAASDARTQSVQTKKTGDGRTVRCHRDLLVFRRPADAAVAQTAAAHEADAA